MHLTSKQISFLLLPFFITAIVYIFSSDIANYIRYLFPVYEEYKSKTLDKKATIYLKIEANGKLYQQIKERIKDRNRYVEWIVDSVLHKRTSPKKLLSKKREKPIAWKLQAVFGKLKVAIINGTTVRENGFINGAKVVKITEDKVLLRSKKGEKWLSLFH